MKNSQAADKCPVRTVLSRFSDKWSILVLVTLNMGGTIRFKELQRTIGDISQRLLTMTLRNLEADGLVGRKIYAEVPPRVEYCLTDRGKSLMPHIQALVEWALGQPDILESRRTFTQKGNSG